MFLQSLRMTLRDWRAGELRFLLVALVVAVAALSSVSFFVERMRTGLNRDARQLMGADLVVSADQPVADAWREEAQKRGLRLADTMVFPSMAIAGQGEALRNALVGVKAVSPDYPLRGRVKVAAAADGAPQPAAGAPAPGTVWVDAALLDSLHIAPGDTLRLGAKGFTVARVILMEPDRGASFMNFAPRVMLAAADLKATGLEQFGSRITYRLLAAGEDPAIAAFDAWIQARIKEGNLKGIRTESLEAGRPEMRATLDRAEQFLALVSLLSAMLAAVAVAMAARRFMLRHLDACAMLRCLGLSQAQATQLYLQEFLVVGLVGSVVGVLIGFGAHFVLLEWLGRLVATELPPPGWLPALQGVAAGLILLVGFAIPSVLQLANVPHNRVIRREQGAPRPLALATYGLGLASFLALLLWQSGDLPLGLLTAAGFIAGAGLFALAGWLSLRVLRLARGWLPHASWRFAIDALQRRPSATVVQVVALALGLMALLLLTVIRGDLVTAWRASTPADAPNRFVINIQPEQKAPLDALLRESGVAKPEIYPMIRGRLLQVNDRVITAETYADDRARRLAEREFNLSTMAAPPAQNKIVVGRWYDDSAPAASVEEGLAKTLNLKLGDVLHFDIAGQRVSAPITSLRKLEWGSMRVNFFVIMNPALMRDTPQTFITAFHLPAGQPQFARRIAQDFPNLTVVDVGGILKQVQDVIDQVVAAVEFLFLFTLASGVLVLYAALAASQDERTREAGILRALGATRSQLARAQWIELSMTGGLAGLLAASGAAAIGWLLAKYVFKFDWNFEALVWLAGMGAGVACALFGGWISLRGVLNRPPLQTLREA